MNIRTEHRNNEGGNPLTFQTKEITWPQTPSEYIEAVAIMGQAVEDDVQALLMSESPHSRMVGGTEYSWCKAVSGGTGTTVLAAMFQSDTVSASLLQDALDLLQVAHPRLRSRLLWIHGRPALSVSSSPVVTLQVLQAREVISQEFGMLDTANSDCKIDDNNDDEGAWLKLVERELNINTQWKEQSHSLEPQPMMALTLYIGIQSAGERDSGSSHSLLVLRLHTAICDRASAATILTELMHILSKLRSNDTSVLKDDMRTIGEKHEEDSAISLVAIEDAIPKGHAHKPFWAHGIDILGDHLQEAWHRGYTKALKGVQSTEDKSVRCVDSGGAQGNGHFEGAWAVKRRKHFTDMGDVGLLMCQAIQMPQLTPWGSLRTSTLVVFEEAVEDDDAAADMKRSVGLIDYVGCSSVHGVGPSIAIFDTIRQSALHCTCVYPCPLHSRTQINQLLDTMFLLKWELQRSAVLYLVRSFFRLKG
ncbi:hypothetical protein L7F22_068645 [Adiantum nelumboides]|nr:hypothetical protein [Adiantum nelumboides]